MKVYRVPVNLNIAISVEVMADSEKEALGKCGIDMSNYIQNLLQNDLHENADDAVVGIDIDDYETETFIYDIELIDDNA